MHPKMEGFSDDLRERVVSIVTCPRCDSSNIRATIIPKEATSTNQRETKSHGVVGYCKDCYNGFAITVTFVIATT